jgi:hypothetical protein
VDPQQLPCFHFFCQACLRTQVTNQKTVEVLPRCAECNVPFTRRQLVSNKKFNSILEVFRSIRQANNLCTQLPQVDLFMANNQRRVEHFKQISARLKMEAAAEAPLPLPPPTRLVAAPNQNENSIESNASARAKTVPPPKKSQIEEAPKKKVGRPKSVKNDVVKTSIQENLKPRKRKLAEITHSKVNKSVAAEKRLKNNEARAVPVKKVKHERIVVKVTQLSDN